MSSSTPASATTTAPNATAIVAHALFGTTRGDETRVVSSSNDADKYPGERYLAFLEGRPTLLSGAGGDTTTAASAQPQPPLSADNVSDRLTAALQHHVIDPTILPQLLQPSRLPHDILPRALRILQLRHYLKELAGRTKREGDALRAQYAATVAAVAESNITEAGADSAAPPAPARVSNGTNGVAAAGGDDNNKKREEEHPAGGGDDDDNAATSESSAAAKTTPTLTPPPEEDILRMLTVAPTLQALDGADNDNAHTPSTPLSTSVLGSNPEHANGTTITRNSVSNRSSKHVVTTPAAAALAAWGVHEAAMERYIAEQTAALDSHAEATMQSFDVWAGQLERFLPPAAASSTQQSR